ncbi:MULTISPECIES: hypothetical protein [Streptomyces]|uniref:Uncharacterized protein n=3 Tax=Streptomyces TaxID=1883 RepID=A0A8I0TR65_9ACTN|nr:MULTISPECIES: hypothetical protein [Streptomyces]MBE1596631.1 hypothetical protein [Streptomyces stelliscabiei]MDX2517963.1 hypothetical protein [Streptomyces stelliscabiei]BBC30571.1 uncharacterized protein SGFS_018650 [Streptomyces graminofaciens]SOD77863.1 hypothetical protein SAMN06272781_5759 [Streptomyces sp. 1222.2]
MDLESRLRLAGDVPAVEEFLSSTAGRLHHRDQDPDGLYWAEVQPNNGERAAFIARIEWTVYPDRPPSLVFVESIGVSGVGAPSAWPGADGYRYGSNDVCKPFTAEGQRLHAEWSSGPHSWRSTGNPFLYVVENVQDDIDRVDGRRAG